MDQAQFEKEYHWLYGLDEYYQFTGQTEDWDIMRKALMNSNYYRIRDVVLRLMEDDHKIPEYQLRRSCLNVLFRNEMEDVGIKPQMVANLIDRYMIDDDFITAICRFINYWGGDGAEGAVMPDLNDFLSRGQVRSKLWLVSELAKIVDGPIGNVLFYGGWYNFSAHFLFSQFEVNKIYSLDVDRNVIEPSKRLYPDEVENERFLPKSVNVNKVAWNGKTTTVPADDGTHWILCEETNMVVNTSCEHMDNTWYDNIPSGTFIVLQTNDYFENEQHSNCCKDLEDAKDKYPMQNVFYAGELDTQLYNRFMLIGIK